MSYAKFRSNSNINNLKDKFTKLSGKTSYNDFDDTYWTPKHVAGETGKGEAILRFLPAPPDGEGGQEPDDIVKYFQYSTRKNGKFYINRGRNSLSRDEPDPANDYNTSIWQRSDLTKDEKKKLIVDRAENYIANIFVVKDPNKPENEGKVFRWQFGRQIYGMIEGQLFPEFETDPSVPVFDPELGADFILRVTQKVIPDRYTGESRRIPTYEESKFAAPSKRWDLDEFDEIWQQCHSLQSEVAPDKFKPYDELKRQFDRVMGFNEPDQSIPTQERAAPTTTVKKPKEEKSPSEELEDEVPWITDDEEEDNTNETSESSESPDVDDWFANLGK